MEKIVITTTSFGEYGNSCLEKCRRQGFEVTLNPYKRKVNQAELIDLAKEAVGLVAGTESITKGALLKLSKLRVISRCGAGMDSVDVEAAKELKIKVYNTPDAPTLAVAELALGLMLCLLRKINEMDSSLKHGKWEKKMGYLLGDKKVGIIGFGRIGRKIAELLEPFGCEIAYNDPFVEKTLSGLKNYPKDALLKWADIITLHVSTNGIILGEKEFRLMKKGAWLVNVARGGIINEAELYRGLKEGRIGGAALDVFQEEPYNGPLREFDNVILTPHVGSYAREARIKMEMQAVENLLKGLKEKKIKL